ncbi:uncharacterized protein LOC144806642 [Lissotriton helveticus]
MSGAFRVSVKVNGYDLQALLDSGCRQSFIQSQYVTSSQYVPRGSVNIKCVHRDIKPYPIANISIDPTAGTPHVVKVGVMSSLPEDLIIGTDNPGFLQMFKKTLDPIDSIKIASYGRSEPDVNKGSVRPEVITINFAKLSKHATSPTRGSTKAAGYDLYSAYDYEIPAREKALIKTDIQIAIPLGCCGRIAPRSGLAAKHFIDVGAGVIDEDYRGNVMILLFNLGTEKFVVRKGDRVAQLLCEQIATPTLRELDELDHTDRGVGGFGSTDRHEKPIPALLSPDPWVLDRSFRFAQTSDPTLFNAWEQANQRPEGSDGYPKFLIQDELLYRIGKVGDSPQLIVPTSFRDQVLFFGHSHLVAGHAGAEKTTQNITKHFFWPGI